MSPNEYKFTRQHTEDLMRRLTLPEERRQHRVMAAVCLFLAAAIGVAGLVWR